MQIIKLFDTFDIWKVSFNILELMEKYKNCSKIFSSPDTLC